MERETIFAMADAYANNYAEDYPFTKDTVFAAFVEGTGWANKKHSEVWHGKKEEPDNYAHIVYVYHEYGCLQMSSFRADKGNLIDWKRIVEIRHIEMWAYVEDVLPKY